MVAILYFLSQSLVSANIGLRKFLAHRQMNSAVVLWLLLLGLFLFPSSLAPKSAKHEEYFYLLSIL